MYNSISGIKSLVNRYAKESGDNPGKWNNFGYSIITEICEYLMDSSPDNQILEDFQNGAEEALRELHV